MRVILSALVLTALSSSLVGQQPQTAKTQPKFTDTVLAEPSLFSLPPRYVGDDPRLLFQKLAALGSRLQKSEFETTEQFHHRVSALLKGIQVSSARTANDRLTFAYAFGSLSYDADSQIFAYQPEHVSGTGDPNYVGLELVRSERNLGSTSGHNRAGHT
jgi:hypothetical protein